MNQLQRIEQQNDRIIELLEKLTGQQLPGTGGVTRTGTGVFAAGSGPIPEHTPTTDTDRPDDPAERERILERARAERHAAATQAQAAR